MIGACAGVAVCQPIADCSHAKLALVLGCCLPKPNEMLRGS
jgi:hypothetical protein